MSELAPGSQTVLDDRPVLDDEGDHERYAHYAPKDKVTKALIEGTPVVALCGKVWVPTKNPDNYPVCPECKEIWESLPKGR